MPGKRVWLSNPSKRETDSGKGIRTATAIEMITVDRRYLSLYRALILFMGTKIR